MQITITYWKHDYEGRVFLRIGFYPDRELLWWLASAYGIQHLLPDYLNPGWEYEEDIPF